MELYILRHGIAEPRETSGVRDDSERALTQEGAAKIRRIAEGMKALEYSFDAILTSPFRRARETAEIVASVLRLKECLTILPALAAGEKTKELMQALQRRTDLFERILMVGHEPDLSILIAHLVTGGPDLAVTLKKGALCKLSVTSLRHGRCAVLEWLAPPSQLTRIR